MEIDLEVYDLERKRRRENPERSRILAVAGPGAQEYRIVSAGDNSLAAEFRTIGVNGKTPDGTAEANVADWSDRHDGEFLLFDDAGRLMGWARGGVYNGYGLVG